MSSGINDIRKKSGAKVLLLDYTDPDGVSVLRALVGLGPKVFASNEKLWLVFAKGCFAGFVS